MKQTYAYKLYQIKKVFSYFYGFLSLDFYKDVIEQDINLSRYNLVYEGSIELELDSQKTEEQKVNSALEELYKMFNIQPPTDFKGHSLSVGDIIEINNKFYYCDSIGWQEIQPIQETPTCRLMDYVIYQYGYDVDRLKRFLKDKGKSESYINNHIAKIEKEYQQYCLEQGFKTA